MLKLLPVVVVSLMLAILSEKHSATEIGELGEKKYIKKDAFFLVMIIVVLAMFVGLRTHYNDTGAYRRGYMGIQAERGMKLYKDIDWSFGKYPGFAFLNVTLKLFGVSTQGYLIILAFIVVGIYIWFIRKYTENIWLSVFLFIATGCYVFTMAGQKQVLAVAFCTIGVDRAIRKKWLPFVFWILLGSMFHPYTILFLAVPLLDFVPWTARSYLVLGIFTAISIGFQPFLEHIEEIGDAVGKTYSAEELSSGAGVNIFRVLVTWVPVVISFSLKSEIKENGRADNIMQNLTMLNAELMFIGLFGTAILFARLANYFLLYSTVVLPRLIKYYPNYTRKILMLCLICGYIAYFYYDNSIAHPFDMDYVGISVFDYLPTIF